MGVVGRVTTCGIRGLQQRIGPLKIEDPPLVIPHIPRWYSQQGFYCPREHLGVEHKPRKSLERSSNGKKSGLYPSRSIWTECHLPGGCHYHGLPSTER